MKSLYEQDKKYILNTYNRLDLIIEKGEGSYVFDIDGNKYLDMYSGISVNNLGHDKGIVEAIIKQASKYMHLSNYFVSEPVVNLAKLFVENTFASKVFFTNSGTESNEAAIKLCRKYGKQSNENKYELLSAYNSFHGRTTGALALTGQEKYQKNFMPLIPGVSHFKYNDIEDLRAKVNENTCGLFLEIIQGEGGIVEISKEFIDEVVKLSKKYDFLIVIDEIQAGMGRTGDLFAYEQYDFTPHIVTISKSVGGGIPLGAMLVSEYVENILQPGDHGSTFAANPVSCAGGEYVMNKLVNTDLCNEVKSKGNYLINKLNNLKEKYPHIIKEVRGRGLMIGIDVGQYVNDIKKIAQENRLLLNSTNNTIIRLLPSLCITTDEINEFLTIFEKILKEVK
ncbi:aspartate aminotransferase family protein [Romboutsia sedimentorum]|uniref:Aspartate aminotransferase family protein n=1 Tax=Romboutsia sedimentorum TaxID=1368474 RepID=A0ABT7EB97_9FIRM|nr:aspartate aminotransferase family protein [Romboutsia sedimentorum]MDK2564207.1 aspartate aminotransferase family protein [Romboutsia sedimentorum]